jgi:hypothetical protein
MLVGLSACGGEANLTCDEPRRYQQAVDHNRVQSPEDLDSLEPLREMPLPQANPTPERPAGSPCLDLPPRIGTTN